MSQEKNYKEIPKLSKEVIDLIKDFPNYYDYDHNKVWIFGESVWIGGPLVPNPAVTEVQKKEIEKKITNDELKERYKKYGLCPECQQPNTYANDYKEQLWCQSCNSQHFQEEFDKCGWTSGNKKIDKFIKDYQQRAIHC